MLAIAAVAFYWIARSFRRKGPAVLLKSVHDGTRSPAMPRGLSQVTAVTCGFSSAQVPQTRNH
jgi:hypothetical protein